MSPNYGRPAMSPTFQTFMDEFTKFQNSKPEDQIPKPLMSAAVAHFRAGEAKLSEVGPLLGTISALSEEWNYRLLRVVMKVLIPILRRFGQLKRRPLWNDFEMTRWMLTREPRYVSSLLKHLERSTNPDVLSSGLWMVNSVCQQEPEFAQEWERSGGKDWAFRTFGFETGRSS